MTLITPVPWPFPHMSLVTDLQLDALRGELKKKASASRQKDKKGHTERQYELAAAAAPDRRYRLFVRQSLSNQDVFSVGLTLILPESELILCRYNSGHHGHRNILEKVALPPAPHQHITMQRYIEAELDFSGFAILRTEYNCLAGALALLVQECNITDVIKLDTQSKLFPP